MENIRPNGQRASTAIILLWIMLGMEVISIISGYFEYEILYALQNGGEFSIEAAEASDTRQQVISILYMLAYITSIVTFIMWFRRAYYNLHQKVNNLMLPEGWAAGSWFLPIISLFRPYQIMKEMYQETARLISKKDFLQTYQLSSRFLGWWWGLWIICSMLGQFSFRYSMKAESVEQLLTVNIVDLISNMIGIPLALLAIKVVKDYSAFEPLLEEIDTKPVVPLDPTLVVE